MPKICNITEWFSAKVSDTKVLNETQFIRYVQENCQKYNFLNKHQLYKPLAESAPFLLIKNTAEFESEGYHRHLPNLLKNIKCFNFLDRTSHLNKYVVIPFDNAKFGILENKTWNSKLINLNNIQENVNLGFWSSNVEWLKVIKKSELWTDDSCLLIRHDIWQKFKKNMPQKSKVGA
jgi:hypothetical protein